MILNKFFFGSEITKYHIGGFISCLLGIIFIVQPNFLFSAIGEEVSNSGKTKGYVIRMLGVFFNSLGDISLKKIGGKVDSMYVIHYMGIVNCLTFSFLISMAPSPSDINPVKGYLALMMVGIISWFCHYCYSRSYQIGNMNLNSLAEYTGIIFSFIADYFIFDRTYNVYCIIGVAIIVLSLYGSINKKQ